MKNVTRLIFAIFFCLISLVANASDKAVIYAVQTPDVNIEFIGNNFNETFIEFNNENNIPVIKNSKNPKISANKLRKHNTNSNSKKNNNLTNFTISPNHYFYKQNFNNKNKLSSLLRNEILTRAP